MPVAYWLFPMITIAALVHLIRTTYRPKALLLLSLLTLQGCSLAGSVALYKYRFKDRLIDVCEKDEACAADVEQYFDQCLKDTTVREMITTIDADRSREMNEALQRETILCINEASGVKHFTLKESGNS